MRKIPKFPPIVCLENEEQGLHLPHSIVTAVSGIISLVPMDIMNASPRSESEYFVTLIFWINHSSRYSYTTTTRISG
jgi:hypothetical protein